MSRRSDARRGQRLLQASGLVLVARHAAGPRAPSPPGEAFSHPAAPIADQSRMAAAEYRLTKSPISCEPAAEDASGGARMIHLCALTNSAEARLSTVRGRPDRGRSTGE